MEVDSINAAQDVIPGSSDPELRAAILRMSRHIAWMFWLWIGIPLIMLAAGLVLIVVALGGGSV